MRSQRGPSLRGCNLPRFPATAATLSLLGLPSRQPFLRPPERRNRHFHQRRGEADEAEPVDNDRAADPPLSHEVRHAHEKPDPDGGERNDGQRAPPT